MPKTSNHLHIDVAYLKAAFLTAMLLTLECRLVEYESRDSSQQENRFLLYSPAALERHTALFHQTLPQHPAQGLRVHRFAVNRW